MVFEGLEEIADILACCVVELRESFGYVAKFARDHGPAMLTEPYGSGMHTSAIG